MGTPRLVRGPDPPRLQREQRPRPQPLAAVPTGPRRDADRELVVARPASALGSPAGQCLRRMLGRCGVEPGDGTASPQVPDMARCGVAPVGQHLELPRRDGFGARRRSRNLDGKPRIAARAGQLHLAEPSRVTGNGAVADSRG